MTTKSAIAGINLKTHICDAVAQASDSEARREMVAQGLVILDVTADQARQMLGEKVDLPLTLEDLMKCPPGASSMAETATHAVFAEGRKLPPSCHQAFLVGVIQSATWALRRASGDGITHAALTAAANTLNDPVLDRSTVQ